MLMDVLRLPEEGCRVSLVGSGGKTTLLHGLAQEAKEAAKAPVCILTTTHMQMPTPAQAVFCETTKELTDAARIYAEKGLRAEVTPIVSQNAMSNTGNCVFCIGSRTGEFMDDGVRKITSPPRELLETAETVAPWIICEADGAKRMPAKCPREGEPVLLEDSYVIAVFGLSALGKPIDAVCFRSSLARELFRREGLLSKQKSENTEEGLPNDREKEEQREEREEVFTLPMAALLLTSEEGQRKGVKDISRYRIVLNQADDKEKMQTAEELAAEIRKILPEVIVTAGSLQKGELKCL